MKFSDVLTSVIGRRAKFVGKDRAFHGQREGKVGTIVQMIGPNVCYWQLKGDPAVFVTEMDDLEILA